MTMTNYNPNASLVLSKLMVLIIEEHSPDTVYSSIADDMMILLRTTKHYAEGEKLTTNDYEQCIYDIASASEQLANALVNYHELVKND